MASSLTAAQKWIDPGTKKPNFAGNTSDDLETRTVAAAELYKEGFYRTITQAAKEMDLPYSRLRSRILGHRPRTENGGNRTKFNSAEEQEILCWARARIAQGDRVQTKSLRQFAQDILVAHEKDDKVSKSWARRFKKRNPAFDHRKTSARDARRRPTRDQGVQTDLVCCCGQTVGISNSPSSAT